MIGIFDSGAGGLAALSELRKLSPNEDILFLADRKNAPYGTKSEKEVLRLAENNISRLLFSGASSVLIACCTASTVHEKLPPPLKERSVPIIEPAAKLAAASTKNGNIAVIATERTVKSGAFGRAIRRVDPTFRVKEYPAQELVEIAERVAAGESADRFAREKIKEILDASLSDGADTLVLGCTHFSHLKEIIKSQAKGIKIIDSAKIGAEHIANGAGCGFGATVFL
ncbi:MAG: aspartate/glutamate racemase family protein [Clostridia bacterium]|nr:aspartate/glutamate racemase family protein [Clostridia bacterium]